MATPKSNKSNCQVFHFDLYGKREDKYNFLNNNSLDSITWSKLEPNAPNYFFVKKDFGLGGDYEKGFKLDELFVINASGITTERDHLTIQFEKSKLEEIKLQIFVMDENSFRNKYTPKPDGRDWKISYAKNDLAINKSVVTDILYRPFDLRKTLYTGKSKGFMAYPRHEISYHLLNRNNFAFLCLRQSRDSSLTCYFVANRIFGKDALSSLDRGTGFPLYLYPETSGQQSIGASTERTPNLNMAIVQQIADGLGLAFTSEKEITQGTFAPIDILDYIYAVLHSPTYREQYKEFLKIDFPRVPYPTNAATFWQLVNLGSQIRQIHLLESPTVEQYITQYPIDGDHIVTKPTYQNSKVYINDTQYFDNVPQTAWEFYIGGYQPAQKWLKDRKDRKLEFDDIIHYQKIIVALTETDRLMKEIDKIEIE